jgi:hypothetical protein
MRICLAIMFVLFAEAAYGQSALSVPEQCGIAARRIHFKGPAFARQWVDRCIRDRSHRPAVAPVRAPAAPPPSQPLTARARSCNRQVAELGLTGGAATNYLRRCLSAH